MASEEAGVIERFYELSRAGDPACWDFWDEDAVSSAPPEFPEGGVTHGLDQIKRWFAEWRSIFGRDWWEGLGLDGVTELPDGRVLADVSFDMAGERSGAPVRKQAAVLYTLEDGRITHAAHFMDRSEARAAAR